MSLKILLLQARNAGDQARGEERHSFAARAGLEVEQFVPHNLLAGPPSLQTVRQHDALMIGGSGDYYVSKQNLPQFDALLDLLREVTVRNQPVFASCFGFQLLAKALGGDVIHDLAGTEVGTYDLTLTEAGRRDELLGALPPRFPAQLGRKDRVARLPADCTHLAASDRCPFQAFRIAGRPIWATQFHPELSGPENLARFRRYQAGYAVAMSDKEQRQTLDRFRASPETERLLPRFLEIVFG